MVAQGCGYKQVALVSGHSYDYVRYKAKVLMRAFGFASKLELANALTFGWLTEQAIKETNVWKEAQKEDI